MQEQGLVSNYTVAQFKLARTKVNGEPVKNESYRDFDDQKELAVVVSDLTYVRVNGKWLYVCLFVDFLTVKSSVIVQVRRRELKKKLIDEALVTFGIKQSLSMNGCPYDNTVAEAMFKVVKTKFTNSVRFGSLD